MNKANQILKPPYLFTSKTSPGQRKKNDSWVKTVAKYMSIVVLVSLPQIILAEKIKIQNNLDVILMFDEVLNRQSIKIKSRPVVILPGDEGVVTLGSGTSLNNLHLKIRYIVGQSGSPLNITFGNNMGKCYVYSNSDAVSTSIDYSKEGNCGNSTIYIVVSGTVTDILNAYE